MGDKLLIRAYDVEVGDCIYVRIPKAKKINGGNEDFHMLIDCGTKGKKGFVETAMKHLESDLPASDQPGRKRLDLIVVSHEHEDHIKGFDPEYFTNIDIENIWMSAAMNPDHPQAQQTHNLHKFAVQAMKSLAGQNLSLHPDLADLVARYSISNDDALEALRTTWPNQHDFTTQYVRAGMTHDDLGLELSDTVLRILGPENDIDRFYLGEEAATDLNGLQKVAKNFAVPNNYAGAQPGNISLGDFHRLRARMLSNSLAFAELESEVKNNTSTILMIEWKGKRLLFVGDLEWDGGFKEGKHNAGWNVAWHERKNDLDAPLEFLKIGHHGSTNATPWNDKEDETVNEPSTILDAILPVVDDVGGPTAKAVVSTNRAKYKTIPKSVLLVEIGRRVQNTRNYEDKLTEAGVDLEDLLRYEEFEEKWLDEPQPLRTDFENLINGKGFVEVEISS